MQKQTKQIHLNSESIGNIISLEYGSGLTESKRKGGKYPVFGSNGIVGYHDEYSVNGPGIVVGRKGSIGEVNWSDESFWPIDTTYFVKLKNVETSLRWVYYMLSHKNLKDLNSATGIPGLNRNDVYNATCFLPHIKEQQKIASILSNVDSLIQKTDQIIEQTRILKKGLMQRLLTKGIGHTKFKKTELGEIPENWDVDEIQNHSKITTGNKNTQDRIEGGRYPFFVRSQKIERINTYSFDGEAVLTAGDGVGTGKVFHYINGKFDFHQRVYKMSNFSDRLSGYFFYLYFSNYFLPRVMSMSAKASVDSVRMDMIAKMRILLPPVREQQKISSIISNVDELIQTQQNNKTNLDILKKGLMQQLLTGKIRVKV